MQNGTSTSWRPREWEHQLCKPWWVKKTQSNELVSGQQPSLTLKKEETLGGVLSPLSLLLEGCSLFLGKEQSWSQKY